MDSAKESAIESFSDDIGKLCDALAAIRTQAQIIQRILPKLVDKNERKAARKMIGMESLELLRIAHER